MTSSLTIAIPTFNRCEYVEAHFKRIIPFIISKNLNVAILICDNVSTDGTEEMVIKWAEKFPNIIYYNKNERNVGLIGNYLACINHSKSLFTWVVGDDDIFLPELIIEILDSLSNNSISLVTLNFSYVKVYNDFEFEENSYGSFYDNTQKNIENNAKVLCEKLVDIKNAWGFLWLTSTVVQTELAKQVINESKTDFFNLAYPIYLNLLVASKGKNAVFINSYNKLYCYIGVNSWSNNLLELEFFNLPDCYIELVKKGYSKKVFLNQILKCYNPHKFLKKEVLLYAIKNPLFFLEIFKRIIKLMLL